MSRKISASLRKAAAQRAGYRCEYCRLPAGDSYYGFHVDHIISLKHGGDTALDNLACCCPDCNRNKGADLGTFLDTESELVRFFNPRKDDWNHHFLMDESGMIHHKTSVGAATVKIFLFNHPDRIIERRLLWRLGLLP
ncbi:MAG: HNH endonuclease [Haliscomenobacter sp.]|nr:HNH endonuclease [Haliscomenobacter sp.]